MTVGDLVAAALEAAFAVPGPATAYQAEGLAVDGL